MSSWVREQAECDADPIEANIKEEFGLLVLAKVEQLMTEKLIIYDGHRGPIIALVRSLFEETQPEHPVHPR